MRDLTERVRAAEFECVRHYFEPGKRILEIGGGNGYQANIIASLGCTVVSIDVPGRPIPRAQYFEVIDYDGVTLPFGEGEFDLVFSSHVLEHVRAPEKMLAEIHRVTKHDGRGVHILPSAFWRLWTIPAHYLYAIKYVLGRRDIPGLRDAPTLKATALKKGFVHAAKRALFPGPHGEYTSAIAEIYYYTRRRWCRVFRSSHFHVDLVRPSRIFVTGYGLFPSFSVRSRRRLAMILGSSSTIFVLSPS